MYICQATALLAGCKNKWRLCHVRMSLVRVSCDVRGTCDRTTAVCNKDESKFPTLNPHCARKLLRRLTRLKKVIVGKFNDYSKRNLQSTLAISTLVISNNRLSRRENLVRVLTQKSKIRLQNIVEKRRNCS